MKKLNRTVLVAFALLTLYSCNYARFDRAPGPAVQEIPAEYHGKFFAKASDKKLNDGQDTTYILVGKDFYQETGSEKLGTKNKQTLGKDFWFSRHKGFDVISVQSEEDSLFTIFVLEPNKNGFSMRALDDHSTEKRMESKGMKGKYSKFFSEKCKPSQGQTVWFYVMDESKLNKAYRKKIRKMPGIDFIRTQ